MNGQRRSLVMTGAAVLVFAAWLRRRFPHFRPVELLLSRATLLPPETQARVQKRLLQASYATMNLLLALSVLIQGEFIAQLLLGVIVPVIIVWYLLAHPETRALRG